MTSAIQIVISQNCKSIMLHYLKSFVKFAQIVNISISPTSDLVFSVVNENQSCFASFKIQASALHRQSSEFDPNDPIFTFNFQQPLKSLLFHLQGVSKINPPILLEFTHSTVHFIHFCEGFDLDGGFKGSWRGLLPPVLIENPIFPSLEVFPIRISGFSPDWFNILLEAVGSGKSASGLKSTLILKTSPSTGVKMLFPGNIEAEIDIPPFNFNSFHAAAPVTIVVSLREFSALMSVAKKQKVDLFFGPPGHPLVALIRESSGIFECKFVLATISLETQENEPETVAEIGDEHVSGTEDEDELDETVLL